MTSSSRSTIRIYINILSRTDFLTRFAYQKTISSVEKSGMGYRSPRANLLPTVSDSRGAAAIKDRRTGDEPSLAATLHHSFSIRANPCNPQSHSAIARSQPTPPSRSRRWWNWRGRWWPFRRRPGAASPLPDVCALRLGSPDVSSFVVTGRNGIAPEPGGWQPDSFDSGVVWDLRLTPDRDRR